MFAQAQKIRTLISRVTVADPLRTNQGAIYTILSRGMAAEHGSGAGKGGGAGGSIREAGGAMGRKGAAQEEAYFAKQNYALKDKLKEHLEDEIKKHEDAIKASKELMKEIDEKK